MVYMKLMKRMALLALVLCTSLGICAEKSAAPQPPDPKPPLSMKTVRVLSVLPFNSPALYYARKPISGTVTTITEGLGLFSMAFGTMVLAADCGNDKVLCDDWKNASGTTLLVGGAAFWLPSYLYALFRAPHAARKYNEKLQNQAHLTWSPYLLAGDQGMKAGVGIRF